MSEARLDVELVRRGLARSRRGAADLVSAGRVLVAGTTAKKVSQPVDAATDVVVLGGADGWVSRAAHKLVAVLDALDHVDPTGRLCLDAGASTGGFTQVLLSRGARHVVAVDVGHDQMAPEVRDDLRVTAREGVNVRGITPADVEHDGARPTLVVADLSFISLTVALPALLAAAAPAADLLVLVKPQFEVGRGRLGKGGVVASPELRAEAVRAVATAAVVHGADVRAVVPSGLPGEHGNREYFLHLVSPTAAGAQVASSAVPRTLVDAISEAVTEDRAVLVGGES